MRRIHSLTAFALLAGTACNAEQLTEEPAVEVAQSALTANETALGFENPTVDWKATRGTLTRSTKHTAGSYAMSIAGTTYTNVTSGKLTTLGNVGTAVTVDLMLPTQQPNPNYYGNLQLYVSIPSRNIVNQWAATKDLTGLPTGKWTTLSFNIEPSLLTQLRATYSDLTVSMVLSVPGTGAHLFDNLQFPVTTSSPVANVLNIIQANNILSSTDILRNRDLLREPLRALTVAESTDLMNTIRSQNNVQKLVDALAVIQPNVVNPAALRAHLYDIYQNWNVDYQIELLTYSDYNSDPEGGYYCSGTSIYITDYAGVGPETVIHESNHSFNGVHGVGGGALNEGTSITIFKTEKNLSETIFGTVLYMRDVWEPSETKEIGDANNFDQPKGQEFMRWVMATDVSKVNWFDPVEVQGVFDACWKNLNRDTDWDTWVAAELNATTCGLNWIRARRPL